MNKYEEEYAHLMEESDKLSKEYEKLGKEEDDLRQRWANKEISDCEYQTNLRQIAAHYEKVAGLMERLTLRAKELQAQIEQEEKLEEASKENREIPEECKTDYEDTVATARKSEDTLYTISCKIKESDDYLYPSIKILYDRIELFIKETKDNLNRIRNGFYIYEIDEGLLISYGAYISFYTTYLTSTYDKYCLDLIPQSEKDKDKDAYLKARRANDLLLSDARMSAKLLYDDMNKRLKKIDFRLELQKIDLA